MTISPEEPEKEGAKEEKIETEEGANLEHFYTQIKSVPQLVEQAQVIDQVLLSRFDEIQSTALNIVHQFDERKKEILTNFDMWLLPVAKEALEELSHDTEELESQLRETLQDLQQTARMDWIEHAKGWARLYTKWYDNKSLMQKVLKMVTDKTTQLIDKDIKVVHDYQNQSLSQIEQETEEFIDIENRLKKATEESLKALTGLKKSPEHLSLKQASEWIAKIQEEREVHFDQLLMKIDSVMKDVVQAEEQYDPSHFFELEGEVVFMEHELHHIHELISNLNLKDEEDVNYIQVRLNGLLEHLEQFDWSGIPMDLKVKVEKIQKKIEELSNRLKK